MANSFTNYTENLVLNSILGGAVLTPPSNLYLGLSTTTIADDGTNITEPKGGNYARVSVANNSTSFPTVSNSTKQNGITISFQSATSSWGNIIDFFISDQLINGNILAYGTLTYPKDVTNGDILSFPVNGLTISLD